MYEIHDGVVQCLTGALINLEASQQVLGDDVPVAAREGLERTVDLLRDGIKEARLLMNGLRPELLDEYGLIAAVEHMMEGNLNRTQAKIEWSYRGDFDRLAPPLETTVFRIIQESLGNALRHSGSCRVGIALTREADQIRVVVEDRGSGFDPQTVSEDRLGVRGISQRAKMFGGKASIDSTPGTGTRVVVELPFVETCR